MVVGFVGLRNVRQAVRNPKELKVYGSLWLFINIWPSHWEHRQSETPPYNHNTGRVIIRLRTYMLLIICLTPVAICHLINLHLLVTSVSEGKWSLSVSVRKWSLSVFVGKWSLRESVGKWSLSKSVRKWSLSVSVGK